MNGSSVLYDLGQRGASIHIVENLDQLVAQAIAHEGCRLTEEGALVAYTVDLIDGKPVGFSGRNPKGKHVVRDDYTVSLVDWDNNQSFEPDQFQQLYRKMLSHAASLPQLYAQQLVAGGHPSYQIGVTVITELAWHQLFSNRLFIRAERSSQAAAWPWTILNLPSFRANPSVDGTRGEAFVVINLVRRQILIGGTRYAGEIKKAVFSVLNFLLPQQGILSLHCGASTGLNGTLDLFFGLSGTGKTTLSTARGRKLIGDDEHAWHPVYGVINHEGGCYPIARNLSQKAEPAIWEAVHQPGALIENAYCPGGVCDLGDTRYTDNIRAAYTLEQISNSWSPLSLPGHPTGLFALSADASGVLPPIAWLDEEQLERNFRLGFTSKLGGTEAGITEPIPDFCDNYLKPFRLLPAQQHTQPLVDMVKQHNVRCFTVNTGWYGGPYGVGRRLPLEYTRAMVEAASNGDLSPDKVEYRRDPHFGLLVPTSCPGVPPQLLDPRSSWEDQVAYDQQAQQLANLFSEQLLV